MTTFPPCPSPFNLAAYVLQAGTRTPEKTALSVLAPEASQNWTYAMLSAAVRGIATGLLNEGLEPGDLVLMRLGNTPEFPFAYLGALAAGLVPVPTAAALTIPEVTKIIADLNPALILHDPQVPCPGDDRIITVSRLREMQTLPPAPYHMGDPDRLGYIIYTSGTSGMPSAVMHAHRAIWARQMMFTGWYDLLPDDRVLHAGAFNWTYTLGTGLMDPWTIGATALIPEPGTAPASLPALMARHDATIFAAAPGVYRQALKSDTPLDLPGLRHGLSAGEKMPPALRQRWKTLAGKDVYEAYGMSECSTFISSAPGAPATGEAIGTAQPGRRVCLMTPNGPAPTGQAGTIAVHRSDPGLMLGYWNAPEQTAARFEGDWFMTGDQAVMDEAGQVTYLGRTDDMMNAGGFRVSPLEVEASLLEMPQITGVGVTSVEIKEGVEVIAAFYTAATPLDDVTLSAYARSRLARYKQPRLYRHVETLPTSGNGKLLRRALREQFKATLQ